MKKIALFFTVLALCNPAFAAVKNCTMGEAQPEISRGVEYSLKSINPDLDLSTLQMTRTGLTSDYHNVNFFEYKVSVNDAAGNQFTVETFPINRKTKEMNSNIGGLFLSDVFVVESDNTHYAPHRCQSQYLSFTSLWTSDEVIYATRLVDSNGQIVSLNVESDIFDRLLRAVDVVIENP
jgi:hypothetical protein